MKAKYKEFEITTKSLGDEPAMWDNRNTNYHVVTVKNKSNGKSTRFDFWCSMAQPEFKTEYDVLNAFYVFVSEALSGLGTFSNFCYEFGYDTDSRKAEKTFRACQKSFEKFKNVSGYSIEEMYNFINELSEIAS